ncbi:unnamed protein product [Meganyctiphanes norvegica]|uniref:Uncharacterized protein n=1 Tax=Meganyctiphanes norvegica TaxID=48144 RepID=A0AAV2QN50_MEGNR
MVLVEAARKEAINHVRLKTGMLIDTPQSGGGNTNTGVLAEKYFNPDFRQDICSLIKNEENKENFEILLRDLNVILTVTQGTHGNVNTNKLKQQGIDIMSHIKPNL